MCISSPTDKEFQHISSILHCFVLVQAYFTFQARPIEIGTGEKPCDLEKMGSCGGWGVF